MGLSMALSYMYITYVDHVHPAPFCPLLSTLFFLPASSLLLFMSCFLWPNAFIRVVFKNRAVYQWLHQWRKFISPHQPLLHINTQGSVEPLGSSHFYDRVWMRPILCRSCAGNPSCCGLSVHQPCLAWKSAFHITLFTSPGLSSFSNFSSLINLWEL